MIENVQKVNQHGIGHAHKNVDSFNKHT